MIVQSMNKEINRFERRFYHVSSAVDIKQWSEDSAVESYSPIAHGEILNQPEIQEILLLVKDCKTLEEIGEEGYTEFVKRDVEKLEIVEDLKQYLRENYQKLGHFHNMAYDMFMDNVI